MAKWHRIFSTRIPRMREGNISVCMSVHMQRGYPARSETGEMGYPHPGYPILPDGSTHIQQWEIPFQPDGRVPTSSLIRGVPLSRDGVPPPHQAGWGYSGWTGVSPSRDGISPGDRAAQRVLATRRAVCLLRSRRRTFLSPITLTSENQHFMAQQISQWQNIEMSILDHVEHPRLNLLTDS